MCATCGCGQRDKSHPKYGKGPHKGKIKQKDIAKSADFQGEAGMSPEVLIEKGLLSSAKNAAGVARNTAGMVGRGVKQGASLGFKQGSRVRMTAGTGLAKPARVKKNQGDTMSYSAVGVDHGDFNIYKSDVAATLIGYPYGAYKAKKGKKIKTAARMQGRGMAESAPGLALMYGAGKAGMTGKIKNPKVAAGLMGAGYAGAVGGAAHGTLAAYRNAKKRGDVSN